MKAKLISTKLIKSIHLYYKQNSMCLCMYVGIGIGVYMYGGFYPHISRNTEDAEMEKAPNFRLRVSLINC